LWRAANTPEAAAAYADLRNTMREHFTPAFGQRFIARCIQFSKITLGNIRVYHKALANLHLDPRTADRLAAVLAGARSLIAAANKAITDAEAQKEVTSTTFGDFANSDSAEYAAERDERSFWDHVISQRVRVGTIDFTIGELIDDLRNAPLNERRPERQALLRHGIRFSDDGMDLLIARGKDGFKVLLEDTKWKENYFLHINRLLEAVGLDSNVYTRQVRFGGLGPARAIVLPKPLLDNLFDGTLIDAKAMETEKVRDILRECSDLEIKFELVQDGKDFQVIGDPPKRLNNEIYRCQVEILAILREYEARKGDEQQQ
jgi:hypothetical protein